jgi:hypothetical protein
MVGLPVRAVTGDTSGLLFDLGKLTQATCGAAKENGLEKKYEIVWAMTEIYQEYGAQIAAAIHAYPNYSPEKLAASMHTPEVDYQLLARLIAVLRETTVQSHQNATTPTTEEAVRVRAYQIYEQRGRGDGHALEDWIAAEVQLGAQSRLWQHQQGDGDFRQ